MDDLEKYLDIDYSELPILFELAIKRYIENGTLPGELLQALICNDLSKAVNVTDRYLYRVYTPARLRFAGLLILVHFFQNKAPAACWGSSEAMELWKARRGIRG